MGDVVWSAWNVSEVEGEKGERRLATKTKTHVGANGFGASPFCNLMHLDAARCCVNFKGRKQRATLAARLLSGLHI